MTLLLQVSTLQDVFGWVQLLLTNLGVWSMLGLVFQVVLVVTLTQFLIKSFRGG